MIPILQAASWRTLAPGQESRILDVDVETGAVRVVASSSEIAFEAPNWSPDGRWIVVNAAGHLYRVEASGGDPERIDTGDLVDHNNDHLISRDGTTIYTSSETTGHLFAVPFDGGRPRRISADVPGPFGYFLQGESPDGSRLAYTGAERRDGSDFVSGLFTMAATGGDDVRLSSWPDDSVGCEWSPNGSWLYFSSELGSTTPGHSQLHRMRPDGTGGERLTDDERVNWFPKLAPAGTRLVYLSFPPGTVGHESDVDVVVRSMSPDGTDVHDVVRLRGGQGTLNVNSWAPDSRHFACCDYPFPADRTPDRHSDRSSPEAP